MGSRTARRSRRSCPALTTSSTLCTPSVHSCTTTSEREWKRENSPKLAKISQPSRRTTKKSASRPRKGKARRKGTVTSSKFVAEASKDASCGLDYREERLLLIVITRISVGACKPVNMARVAFFQVFESHGVVVSQSAFSDASMTEFIT